MDLTIKEKSYTIVGKEYNNNAKFELVGIIKEIENIIKSNEIPYKNITLRTTGKTLTDFAVIICSVKYKCKLELYLDVNFDLLSKKFDETDINGIIYNQKYEEFKSILPQCLNNLHMIILNPNTKCFYIKEYDNLKKLLCKSDELIIFGENNNNLFKDLHEFYKNN